MTANQSPSTIEEGSLRVWWVRNPPRAAELHHIATLDEAATKLRDLAPHDLRSSWVGSNAGGLEVFEDGEWTEWYDRLQPAASLLALAGGDKAGLLGGFSQSGT